MMRIYAILLITTSIGCAIPSDDFSFAQHVLFRLYCINRMRPAMKIIKQLPSDQLSAVDKPMIAMGGTYKEKSVLQLWKDVKQYKNLYDTAFFPYVLCRVLVVLVQSKKVNDSNLSKDFYEINVEELLSAIDVVVSHVHHINQHYHNSGLPFSDWIKQHWWIPSLFIASIFIKVLEHCYLDSELDSENDFSYPLRSSSKI